MEAKEQQINSFGDSIENEKQKNCYSAMSRILLTFNNNIIFHGVADSNLVLANRNLD